MTYGTDDNPTADTGRDHAEVPEEASLLSGIPPTPPDHSVISHGQRRGRIMGIMGRIALMVIGLLLIYVIATLPERIRAHEIEKLRTELTKNQVATVQEIIVRHPEWINQPDKEGRTLLHYAASKGHAEMVTMLLKHGADLHVSTPQGITPFDLAITGGRITVAEILLDHGQNVNVKDRSRQTPLHIAARDGQSDMVALLLARGAQPNAPDRFGQTPLHNAVYSNNADVLALLISKDADVNAKDEGGETPLLKITNGDITLIKMLVEHGADVNVKNDGGVTPLFMAQYEKHKEVAEYLIKHGAKK